jgi:flagellar protein FlbT
MRNATHVYLRPGDRVFVNGAVLRVDSEVSLEFLNDATILLEGHVLQPEDAKTPLRQLYFILQTMLIDPASAPHVRKVFESSHAQLAGSLENEGILIGLRSVHSLVAANHVSDALEMLRVLFPVEDAILSDTATTPERRQIREEESCRLQA